MSEHLRLGNRGSVALEARLKALRVLACGELLDRATIKERGWPHLFPERDRGCIMPGTPDEGERLAARVHLYRLDTAIQTALPRLAYKGLVAEHTEAGWRKKWWSITPAGVAWLQEEDARFEADVLADLAAL